jgi:hypothetical protein
VFELDVGGSPCLGQDIASDVCSSSSMGSDWFDASLAPDDVPYEEWLNASVAPGDILIRGVTRPSSIRRDSGRAPRHSRGRLRVCDPDGGARLRG